jgi:hypothetical protein
MNTLKVSAVALIDALGFRGIEARHDIARVAAALQTARQVMASATDFVSKKAALYTNVLGGPASVKKAWFSDTICVVGQQPDIPRVMGDFGEVDIRAHLVDLVALCVAFLLRSAATSPLPLTFRGVITVGDALVENNDIFFGPAITEAAALYEMAEGAFVWLSPEAAALPRPIANPTYRPLVEYQVPLKGGQSIGTRVVNPFMDRQPADEQGKMIRSGIEEAMVGDRLDVAIKRQNTIRFLDHVATTEPDLGIPDTPPSLQG